MVCDRILRVYRIHVFIQIIFFLLLFALVLHKIDEKYKIVNHCLFYSLFTLHSVLFDGIFYFKYIQKKSRKKKKRKIAAYSSRYNKWRHFLIYYKSFPIHCVTFTHKYMEYSICTQFVRKVGERNSYFFLSMQPLCTIVYTV